MSLKLPIFFNLNFSYFEEIKKKTIHYFKYLKILGYGKYFCYKENYLGQLLNILQIKNKNKPVEPFQNHQHHHNYLRNLKIDFN